MDHYDFLVIGGGPGGYVACIRAAQLGLKAACVEKWPAPADPNKVVYGGTCLNVGCIPSKALLESSHRFEDATSHFPAHGIKIENVGLDLATMQARKKRIVGELCSGIEMLLKRNKVAALAGAGRINKIGPVCEVDIDGLGRVATKNLVLATGSVSRQIPSVQLDNDLIVDNIGALAFSEVPERLCVIGAGVIGLELGSVWRRLGSKVTILEALPDFLAATDKDIATLAAKEFQKQGLAINLNCKVTAAETVGRRVRVGWQDGASHAHEEDFDRLVIAVGRVPYTEGLGATEAGLKLERGSIVVDQHCRSSHPNVYAIGDVVRGPMLAHKAEEEGMMVAEIVAGQKPELDYDCIPWVIYTFPEIAWVGKTEQDCVAAGIEIKSGSFPFLANGRARTMGATVGLAKLVANKQTDRILGVHIFGPNASDLIGESVLAMEFGAAAEDLARTCHAHPTLSEAIKEASLATAGRAIHL